MKIDLPIWIYGGWKVVKAEIVDVAPHITCATWTIDHRYKGSWVVSNIETGYGVEWGRTRKLSIENAIKLLAGKTDKDVLKAWRNIKKTNPEAVT